MNQTERARSTVGYIANVHHFYLCTCVQSAIDQTTVSLAAGTNPSTRCLPSSGCYRWGSRNLNNVYLHTRWTLQWFANHLQSPTRSLPTCGYQMCTLASSQKEISISKYKFFQVTESILQSFQTFICSTILSLLTNDGRQTYLILNTSFASTYTHTHTNTQTQTRKQSSNFRVSFPLKSVANKKSWAEGTCETHSL